jgi:hypothetical protein
MKKFLLMLMASLCLTALATAPTQYESVVTPVETQLCQAQVFCQVSTFASEVIPLDRWQMLCNSQSDQLFEVDIPVRHYSNYNTPKSPEAPPNYTDTFIRLAALQTDNYPNVKAPVFFLCKKGTKRHT